MIAVDPIVHRVYKIGLDVNGMPTYTSAVGVTPFDTPGAIEWDDSTQRMFWTDADVGNLKSALLNDQGHLVVTVLLDESEGTHNTCLAFYIL